MSLLLDKIFGKKNKKHCVSIEDYFMGIYHVCVVSPQNLLFLWKHVQMTVDFIENVSQLQIGSSYDYIFLSTPVHWNSEGVFDFQELQNDVEQVRKCGYSHELVLTSILPIGVAGQLGCHYLPLQQYLFQRNTPILFGCCEKFLIDRSQICDLLFLLFHSHNIVLYFTEPVEMIFLITLCQNYINQSFYKEMSHFCFKNKVRLQYEQVDFSPQMTPILIYMIQQMEEAKLDCPILYSCLFRQHYIDIPI